MRQIVMLLLVAAPLIGCQRQTVTWYEPHINNFDEQTSSFWEYVHPSNVVGLTTSGLRYDYETQTNHFVGSIVVHRNVMTGHDLLDEICVYKSVHCTQSSNVYSIGDGATLADPMNKTNFEEVLQELASALKTAVSNTAPHGTALPRRP